MKHNSSSLARSVGTECADRHSFIIGSVRNCEKGEVSWTGLRRNKLLPPQCVAAFLWNVMLCSRPDLPVISTTLRRSIMSLSSGNFDHLCRIMLGVVYWGLHYGDISIKLERGGGLLRLGVEDRYLSNLYTELKYLSYRQQTISALKRQSFTVI